MLCHQDQFIVIFERKGEIHRIENMLFGLYFLSTSIIPKTVLTGKIESNGFGAELFRGYIDFSVSKKYGNIQEKSILVRELDCKILNLVCYQFFVLIYDLQRLK